VWAAYSADQPDLRSGRTCRRSLERQQRHAQEGRVQILLHSPPFELPAAAAHDEEVIAVKRVRAHIGHAGARAPTVDQDEVEQLGVGIAHPSTLVQALT
jgi:hypothetical protein